MSSSPGLVNHSPLAERTLGDQISIFQYPEPTSQILHVLEVNGPGSFCTLSTKLYVGLVQTGLHLRGHGSMRSTVLPIQSGAVGAIR